MLISDPARPPPPKKKNLNLSLSKIAPDVIYIPLGVLREVFARFPPRGYLNE